MLSPFGEILRDAVDNLPGAIGGALAAGDGETVDSWSTWDEDEWALLTAHFGILVSHIRSALHTFHFGDVQFLYLAYGELDLVIQIVDEHYFALIALEPPVHLGTATQSLQHATTCLRKEML